jgi:hypothetical protein
MPWFKVDDKKAAMGVWVLAGSWSSDNLQDGFVPETVLPRWGNLTDAKRLVDAGLWTEATKNGEKGWQFHDWQARNPTRSEVEKDRADNAERIREWRRKKREQEEKRGA